MPIIDTEETTRALRAFQFAWLASIEDYQNRKVNSEHTLQSALYHHLRSSLPDNYNVYTEAVIRLSERTADESARRKVVVDLLVCKEKEIIVAVELKYTPRGLPTLASLRKDVQSLSCISNRRESVDRVSIEMPRFREADSDSYPISISTHRKLIVAAFFDGREDCALSDDKFWPAVRPEGGEYWSDFGQRPKNLGVALAQTDDNGKATAHYFGGPFDRMAASDA